MFVVARNYRLADIREKPTNFFLLFNTGVNFSLRNNFANSDFAKVFIPVHNYNSLVEAKIFLRVVHPYFKCV